MVIRKRCWRSVVVAMCAAFIPQLVTCQNAFPSMEIGMGNSDEYADAVFIVRAPRMNPGISFHDHAKITRILNTTREMADTASALMKHDKTLSAGKEMMERASDMFNDAKNFIRGLNEKRLEEAKEGGRSMVRGKYSGHDINTAKEDEERMLDISRALFAMYTTFPECVEKLLEDCLAIINGDLASLGLSTIEVVIHEKRNANQDGYNKVVIVTNELADRVKGRLGDGIVTYPFLWDDAVQGQRILGVDGKWNCYDSAPEDCCQTIKESVPNQDTKGKNIECHIFVPFGGVGNPRRSDRVFINLSPDGRVHEPPIIQ